MAVGWVGKNTLSNTFEIHVQISILFLRRNESSKVSSSYFSEIVVKTSILYGIIQKLSVIKIHFPPFQSLILTLHCIIFDSLGIFFENLPKKSKGHDK
jgi:hypothetical protein